MVQIDCLEEELTMSTLKFLLAGACGLLVSCAVITVNVYFPEKAVKDAYKSVDGMMLKGSGNTQPAPESQPPDSKDKDSAVKPLSSMFRALPALSFAAAAYAADSTSDSLAVELASMPEVTKAYATMSRNLPRVRELLAGGAVGLSSQGLIAVRDKTRVTPQDEALLKTENDSRKTIITGMAKAIAKHNNLTPGKEEMDQLLAKSAATYAEAKRDEAAPGWWMQLQNGRWVQK
jgi:hypothetical protein